MKVEEIEEVEMGERIMNIKAQELFDKAEEIYKKQINFKNFSKWKKFLYSDIRGTTYLKIKEIQMELLDKEVEEALTKKQKIRRRKDRW